VPGWATRSPGHIDVHPRPAQPGGPRIVIGGRSPAVLRQTAARGHGWLGNGTLGDLAANDLAGLQKAATEVGHPDRLGRLEITFMQLDPVVVNAGTARRYAGLGAGWARFGHGQRASWVHRCSADLRPLGGRIGRPAAGANPAAGGCGAAARILLNRARPKT
jgi:Luciferase-like monooxygenase